MRFRPLSVPALAITLAIGLAACTTAPTTPTTPTTPPGASTVDQSVAIAGSEGSILPCGETYAQSFTASKSGVLDKVSLALEPEGGSPSLLVRIHPADDGEPSNQSIGSGIYAGPYRGLSDYTDIPLSLPATLVAGQEYAILLTTVTCVAELDQLLVGIQLSDVYQGGEAMFRSGREWLRGFGADLVFRTWGPGAPGTNATTSTTTTTLPPPDEWAGFVGCYSAPGKPDLRYDGPKDAPNGPNASLRESFDGTCSGSYLIGVNLIEFASQEEATQFCQSTSEGSVAATPTSTWGFPAPDTYVCEPV